MRQGSFVPSRASKKRRLNASLEARTSEILCKPNLPSPKPRTYHGRVASGRTAGRRDRIEQDWTPTELSALSSWLPTRGTTSFFVFVHPFYARHVRKCEKTIIGCGNLSNLRPLRTDWVVNRLGWPPTLENLLSATVLLRETAYSL